MTTTPDPRAALDESAIEALEQALTEAAPSRPGIYAEAVAVLHELDKNGWAVIARAALATPPAPEAAADRCAHVYRASKAVCGLRDYRHESGALGHPFTAPTPPAPTEAAEALRDALVVALRLIEKVEWEHPDDADAAARWSEEARGLVVCLDPRCPSKHAEERPSDCLLVSPTPPAPTEAAEALRDALLASAVYVANELDWKCVPLDGLRERLDAIIAAARAPLTVDRDRLRELATEARLVSQWYDAVDLMPTELRAELDDLGQHAAAILAALEER